MYYPNDGQIEFIRKGILNGIRPDGRTNNQIRQNVIKTGALLNCNGSSLIEDENNIIYVGIKLEIANTDQNHPTEGIIQIKIDSMKRKNINQRQKQDSQISDKNKIAFLESIINTEFLQTLDKSSLILVEGKKCWILIIDVFLLNLVDESQIDIISKAIKYALNDLQIPQVKIIHNFLTNEDQFELIDGAFKKISFQVPDLITVGQIETQILMDMTFEEFQSVDKKYLVRLQNKKIQSIRSYEPTQTGFQPEEFMKLHEILRLTISQ